MARIRPGARERAVELLARSDLTAPLIAKELRIGLRTLVRWQSDPAFATEVEASRETIRAAIRAEGIANKQNRIDALNDRWRRMAQVIEARALFNRLRAAAVDNAETTHGKPTFEDYAAAGAETGLMVHTVTYLSHGQREEWTFDGALMKSMLDHEKQAAQERGEWTEKRETTLSGSLDVPVREVVVNLPAAVVELEPDGPA